MRTVSIDRIMNAIKRNGMSLVFLTGTDAVSVSKHVGNSSIATSRIVGVYTDECPESWVIDDLIHCGCTLT